VFSPACHDLGFKIQIEHPCFRPVIPEIDIWRAATLMLKRYGVGNHSFRATGITAYLKNGGTLEWAAAMANHASTRTTQLYDRRREEVSLDFASDSLVVEGEGFEPSVPPREHFIDIESGYGNRGERTRVGRPHEALHQG
jgi:hypothetical protein